MVELGWIASKVTLEHLQNLMSQGYMMAAELVTCRMPKDPTSLVLAGGYIVACAVFYKRGFGVTTH
jgi:hypothetical protein